MGKCMVRKRKEQYIPVENFLNTSSDPLSHILPTNM
jgi:hypothetical protein